MRGKIAILIFICSVFVPLNDGYRVQRNDDNSALSLNEEVNFDEEENFNVQEINDVEENLNVQEINDVEENLNVEENFNVEESLNVEENLNEEEHHNENHEVDEQLTLTSPVTDDIGVDGSLESNNNLPIDLCEADGAKMFLPITNNCSLFYDCINKEGSSCPHGMWFDPNYVDDTFCQFPQVICAADNNICNCAEEYPPPPPDPLIESSVSCLKDNRFHLIPSRVSCGRYFICHNDMKYRMECRQGLHYNDKTEMCDYPEVVNCRMPDPECPSEGIKFLPDPTRCEVFYFCVHGFKTKQICPFYHIWDIRSNSCRRQDEATCHLEE